MRVGPSSRWLVPVLSMTGMLSSLQFTLFLPTLPEIPQLLAVNANDATWVVTITLLVSTAGGPVIGQLADIYGKRQILLVSLALLFSGSVIAAIGENFVAVLIGRGLQGVAATTIPVGISVLREALGREESNSAIGFMSATIGIGSALGLPLSGALSEFGGLTSIFWFSAIAGLVVFLLLVAVVPQSNIEPSRRFDIIGAVLLSTLLAALLVGVSKGLVWGITSRELLIVSLIAAIALPLWLIHSFRVTEPIVDLRLSFSSPVLVINVASFFISFGMFANHFLTIHEARAPIDSVIGLGLPALTAGFILLPSTAALVALAPVASRLINRFGGRITLALGSLVIAAAYAFRLVVHEGIVTVTLGAFLVGIGSAFAFTAMPSLINDAVPLTQLASANSINAVARSFAGSVVSALLAFLIAAQPNAATADFISQSGLVLSFGFCAALALAGSILAFTLPRSRPQ